MDKQKTLKDSFTLTGKGLHTGLDIQITFLPAPAGTGRIIRRIDLEGAPEIPALSEYVKGTERGTVLIKGAASVSTIEHAMAALYAKGITNCIIEVNAPEFPILDGSARAYVEAINRVGIEEQSQPAEPYIVKQRHEVISEDGRSRIILLPDNRFGIDVHVSFDSPVLDNQFASLENLADFDTEIATSRTFVFVREVETLLEHNLIKGGDLDNALVIYDTPMEQEQLDKICDLVGVPHKKDLSLGYINNAPILFPNEPARHKLLDVLGDLALIGRPIRGRIIAFCPGHKINNEMGAKIRKDIKLNEAQAPVYDPNQAPLLDVNRIRELLPHRYPFLMVDKIIEIGTDYIVGVKSVSGNEPFFQGHFPTEPVMPGVLQIEAMAQVGGLLVLNTIDKPEEYSTYFMKIDNVKFRQKVVPGDTLIFKLRLLTEVRRGVANMRGLAFVGEKLVCEAEFMAQVVKNK
ncbi:bifunctional UDP-3-O-[3-hydroxymyristoyl] N-acetylglucosamine deacetylase/3-hydroxyacyl-ACP dehydratase [uncultured Porphyromonas sp.]|jgi:beta-hydroxyacyl-(acyl-carrier-protein) dehydratase fabZ|uniref:bifunctional UDP-3-O-[3-hydroxymyristoyl] N-acetylglucosamine deacetylase/3-hydroxyacyl-ACP dehydratase n=1 Tax=uncultured Porphyromonas sp. TaxID=159274 RepID=UPI002614AF3C|nr:bifunctional UDP-3-O-[3-hydroxymyristoyl] N-acetylglucosamine deacetylase/3-hydroxyacyl-ACP dehydratase [uncultured Porphyromonas sp.]